MIRPAKEDDANQIAAIYNHYIEYTSITFEQVPITGTEMASRLKQGVSKGTWLVCENDKKLVGYAYSSPWGERIGYRRSVETSIYLDHSYIKKGLGFELYDKLLEQLQLQQIHTVIGVIGLPNPQSIALHEKLGFKQVAELKQIGQKFGKWVDVGYWQLLF